jgi:hypothetical protein
MFFFKSPLILHFKSNEIQIEEREQEIDTESTKQKDGSLKK